MILFLDTVSSLPEFFLIEDNKIISSKKIIKNNDEKMSDCIVSTYIELNKKFSLKKELTGIIVNTGPGSYTALRVGIAFVTGLSISQEISIVGLSCVDLFRHFIKKKDLKSSAIYICSSNNQNFYCIYNELKNTYEINKIEKIQDFNNLNQSQISKIYTNSKLKIENINNINYEILSFQELVITNLKIILKMPKQELIQPIYVSNNQILKDIIVKNKKINIIRLY